MKMRYNINIFPVRSSCWNKFSHERTLRNSRSPIARRKEAASFVPSLCRFRLLDITCIFFFPTILSTRSKIGDRGKVNELAVMRIAFRRRHADVTHPSQAPIAHSALPKQEENAKEQRLRRSGVPEEPTAATPASDSRECTASIRY